jgi:class 3 adenylate cyclase/tetratricopeptide (TPR) repeat protein
MAEGGAEERKLATVLFADLVGSTSMADDQDPERTRQTLTRFYDAMAEEVERCGGTVEKFAGDAVMAAFGAPAALEDHAERALHAAIAMQRRLTELFGDRLALRIGVNTGEVIVGQPREGSSFVTGDAVNVAARLEQAAEPGSILAGDRTVAAAQGAFEFDPPVTVLARGKTQGVSARPVRRALTLMRPRGVGGLASVFIGREAEAREIHDRYRQVVTDGEPHLVTILGDAGVGKTRLTREIWAWLSAQSPEPTRRTGRTLSYGQGTGYWPMGEILKEQFGISDSDPPETIAARLAGRPYLGLTLGADSGETLHPLVARERLHDAWVEFVGELTRERPVVLLLEDMHWAEDDLYDLVDTLVAQVSGPLLVLVTARPELLDRRPAWGGSWQRTSAMRIDALAAADADRLLDALMGTSVPPAIRDLVLGRAEGNPFFVEELISTLVDRGVLVRTNGTWSFGELPAGFSVPDSVQAVLAARIDLLPAPEKAALQAAAVIGRTFWTGPVYELVAPENPDIGLLEERDFVRRRPGSSLSGEREYVIKHALTREVAYASLPKARRARMHAAFAGWLEPHADGRDELAPLLAHHYARAVEPADRDLAWPDAQEEVQALEARAVTWLRRAAELAVGRYEIDEGLGLLRKAVELEHDSAVLGRLWFEIGHASALKYDGEAFVAAMMRALELGVPPDQVYPELAYQTVQRAGMWLRRLNDDLVEGWIDRALRDSTSGSPGELRGLVAKAYRFDDVDGARTALQVADALGGAEYRSEALGALISALQETGQLAEAVTLTSDRIELLPQITDPDHLADAYQMAAGLYANVGRMADAREMVGHLEMTVGNGLTPHHRVHSLAARTRLELAVGDWQSLRETTSRVENAISANLATPCPFNVGGLIMVAIGAVHGGDESTATRLVDRARAMGMVGYDMFHASRWIRLALARGDLAETRRVIDSLDPAYLSAGNWELWAALLDGLAGLGDRARIEAEAPAWVRPDAYVAPFAARALGIVRDDRGLLAEAAERFERMGLEWDADQTRQLLVRS